MQQWAEIRRRVLVQGDSKRSILKQFGIHWDTLAKMLAHSEPPGYRQRQQRAKPKIGPFLGIIEQILTDDQKVHRKQRHTAKRILDRLRDERGYTGGYTAVKEAVRYWRARHREVFVPLVHSPGEGQVDFGTAQVVLDGVTTKVALFVMTLMYSDAVFCCVYPRECTETFLDGHCRAFAFFGGVPKRISYDNSKIAIARIIGPRRRELTRAFLQLASHYLFASHFCLVRRPNEKGQVEGLVGYTRRNFLVPVPKVDRLEALNCQLSTHCREDLDRRLRGQCATKAQRLEEERPALLTLPKQAFEARRVASAKVDSQALVRFDSNSYSVPTEYAHQGVTVVGGIEQVRIVCRDRVSARHQRHWQRERVQFEPRHYLALLERKPGALDFARPMEHWPLPACFHLLRRRLEDQLGHNGTRQYIKVLRLLESASMAQLAAAIEQTLAIGAISADAVRVVLQTRDERPVGLFNLDGRPHLKLVRVHPPDLAAYRVLAGGAS
jgi:transposase